MSTFIGQLIGFAVIVFILMKWVVPLVRDMMQKQQEAIRLVHLGELSLGEASARSHQSAGALKVACHRALKALRHALDKHALDKKGRHHD